MKHVLVLLFGFMYIGFTTAISAPHQHHSNYAGQEKRLIKSLSPQDIDDLKHGRGWGLAKIAELNGMPGPIHLLEMEKEMELTSNQVKQIKSLFQSMKMRAIPLGEKLIELEQQLNNLFANHQIDEQLLREKLDAIMSVRKELRFVHLSAHLQTPKILNDKQIEMYNQLRGYTHQDPCSHIPKGHNTEMWKKHNNCL